MFLYFLGELVMKNGLKADYQVVLVFAFIEGIYIKVSPVFLLFESIINPNVSPRFDP